MKVIKIPYSQSEFSEIRAENYLYVDKTKFIETLEQLPTKYPIFLRPRRFGKSLLVSTLACYYDRNRAGDFEKLFGGTYIGSHKTELANRYFVLQFDFSGLNTASEELLRQDFYDKMAASLFSFIQSYQLDMEVKFNDRYSAASTLNYFLSELKHYTGKNVYVTIDEYDHFANDIIGDQAFFQQITGAEGFVRNFYEVIKTHAGNGCIDRIFITGVTSMTLDSLTSGFNIAMNVSMMAELNEMVGFTENETWWVLEQIGVSDAEQLMKLLVEQYNGYLFQYEEPEYQRVLNSNLLMHFLAQYQRRKRIPEVFIDSNIRMDYDKLTKMFALFKDEEARTEILQEIMDDKSVSTNIVTNFSFASTLRRDEFLSMLFYLGLLTVQGTDGFDVELKAPNAVIRDVYLNYYAQYLGLNQETRNEVMKALGNHKDFSKLNALVEDVLSRHSNMDFQGFNEARLKSIFLACFSNQSQYLVKSEYESSGRRIDIALLDPRGAQSVVKYNYLIELKYLMKKGKENKKEVTEKEIQEARDDAWQQMTDYLQLPEFQQGDRIKGLIYVVVKDRIVVCEEVNKM